MNYEQMSDFEINKKVGSALGIHIDEEKTKSFVDMAERLECNDGSAFFSDGEFHNYCNNPSDAWPIIVENGISIDFWGDFWGADIQTGCEIAFDHEDTNPLRAAMICFLKMKDAEK